MLEAQIASDVAKEILNQAAEAKALKVVVVNLAVGSMRQLDEPLFLEHLARACAAPWPRGHRSTSNAPPP